jgi:hypothetical protein
MQQNSGGDFFARLLLAPCDSVPRSKHTRNPHTTTIQPKTDNAAASSSGRTAADAAADDGRVLWWQARPSQTAPPRQTLFSKAEGRFINEDVLGLGGSRRAGRPTPVGGELDLPTVEPAVAYLVLVCQLAVYAAGTWVGATQGAGAAEQMALELALVPRAVLEDGEWWRLGTSMLLHTCVAVGLWLWLFCVACCFVCALSCPPSQK